MILSRGVLFTTKKGAKVKMVREFGAPFGRAVHGNGNTGKKFFTDIGITVTGKKDFTGKYR